MTRSSVLPGACRHLLLALLVIPVAACAGSGDGEQTLPAKHVGFRKRNMLMAVDLAINRLMGSASDEVNQLTAEFRARLDDIPTPVALVVTHPILETYGTGEVSRFAARVDGYSDLAIQGLQDVLARYEAAFWAVACEAGRRENGSDFGTRSGYRELDEKVDSALAQLHRKAGVTSVEQMATFRRTDRIAAVRKLQEKSEELGTLALFLSGPVPVISGLGAMNSPKELHEAQYQVLAFEPAEALEDLEWEFVQARRTKVKKGGIVLLQTPWQLDHAAPAGRVPLVHFKDSAIVASVPNFPRPDVTSEDFAALRDHILINEFRTALCRKDTGEVIRTVGWQVVWGVDYRGQTRVLVESGVEQFLEGDPVIPELLGQPSAEEPR